MAKPRNPAGSSLCRAAIEKRDAEAIRQLIANGHKPDAAAAHQAVDACNKAFTTAHRTEAPLFGRMPSKKDQEKAAVNAAIYYEIAEALLNAGAPVPEMLCPVARSGNTKLALLLIRHGADVDYSPPMGTPLENAVEAGDVELMRALIRASADIHCQGIMGTLLTRAVSKNRPEAAAELIKAGVDVNAQTRVGSTALLKAVTDRKSDFVRLLLDAGADVNRKGNVTCGEFGEPEVTEEGGFRTTHIPNPPVAHDSTALIVAARRGYADIAAQLIAAGADLEAVDREGCTALVHALKSNDEPMIKLLSDAGAKAPKYAEGPPEAAFITAASEGDCQRLQAILDEGLDVNLKLATEDEPEATALSQAAKHGHVEAVKLLLKAGATPDGECGAVSEGQRRTPLMHAAQGGHAEVARILIAAGAVASAKDRSGRSVLHYAAEGGRAEVVRVLAKAGGKVDVKTKDGFSPLMEAAGNGHVEAVQILLELGADPNLASKVGCTPLFAAATGGHASVVRTLLDAGTNPKGVTPDFSPLEAASSEGHKEVVDMLLKARGGRNKEGARKGATKPDAAALANAALMGKADVVRTLLNAGADPNAVAEEHFTALMGAVRAGSIEIVDMLLQAGAEVNALNEDRETALDLAYDNIKAAKDQARFLSMIGGGTLDEDTQKAITVLKKSGSKDEITAILKKAGGKRARELKGQRRPRSASAERKQPAKREVELPIPKFGKRAKAVAFQKAIADLTRICGSKPKPVSNQEGDALEGCVLFRVPSATANKILRDHHEAFLGRGCYLLKTERGYTSGKDELTLLPTTARQEVLAAF
jgi:ankyrin repeat protein